MLNTDFEGKSTDMLHLRVKRPHCYVLILKLFFVTNVALNLPLPAHTSPLQINERRYFFDQSQCFHICPVILHCCVTL